MGAAGGGQGDIVNPENGARERVLPAAREQVDLVALTIFTPDGPRKFEKADVLTVTSQPGVLSIRVKGPDGSTLTFEGCPFLFETRPLAVLAPA